jgi:transcriptional regulator with XRE-family HTH domain
VRADLLGVSAASVYRYANGRAVIPPVVIKLIDMYERYGVPEDKP